MGRFRKKPVEIDAVQFDGSVESGVAICGWARSYGNELGVGDPKADGPTLEEAMLGYPPWDSNRLSAAIGVDPEDFDRHTALGDCHWVKAIFERCLGRGQEASEGVR